MKKSLLAIVLFISVSVVFAQNGTQKIVVSDLTKIQQIGSVTISPDGNRVAYTLTTIETDPANKNEYQYRTHIYLKDLRSNTPAIALTRGSQSASQPVWSPDGRTIAFVRGTGGRSQLFLLSLDGGEPIQLTKETYGASSPLWSPNGRSILFSAGFSLEDLLKDSTMVANKMLPTWSYEKPGFRDNSHLMSSKAKPNPDGTVEEIRAYLQQNEKDNKAKVVNKLNFQTESDVQTRINISHLFVIDAKEGAKPRQLTSGFNSAGGASWLNNTSIVYTTASDNTIHPDRIQENQIVSLNISNGTTQVLLKEAGNNYGALTPSGDGRTIAFVNGTPGGLSPSKLALLSNGRKTIIEYDRNTSGLTWSKDNRYLYFTSSSNGGVILNRLTIANRRIERLSDFESGVGSFDVGRNSIAYVKTEVANPFELYTANLLNKSARRISEHNVAWLRDKKVSFPEKGIYTNSNGQAIEYWVMKPAFQEPGKKYPLMLQIHGGPTAMWGPGEASMWHEFQFFASQGFGIVYSNPRGSSGYGFDFLASNFQDWGTGPAEDVLGAESAAAKLPWVDTDRRVVTGGSYAGYLTAWIVAHDNRFKAAAAQRGVYELTTFMGEGNAWRLVPNYFGGYPWDEEVKKVLDRESPYTYVQNINTPLMIIHGENDLRTGVQQSAMMYKSLKILEKPVEYILHPGATHELSRSGNVRQRFDRMLRMYEFLYRYVGE